MREVRRVGGFRRGLTAGLAWLLVAGGAVVVADAPLLAQGAEEPPEWLPGGQSWPEGLSEQQWAALIDAPPESVPLVETASVDPMPEPVWPEASSWTVDLGDGGTVGAAAVGGAPVEVVSGDGAPEAQLDVEVYDRAVAEQVGVSGFVFSLSDVTAVDGGSDETDSGAPVGEGPVPVELSVDFSGFADAYGGNFADRLRVAVLPECALQVPVPVGCAVAGEVLPTQVEVDAQRLVVEVEDLGALGTDSTGGQSGAVEQLDVDPAEAAGLIESANDEFEDGLVPGLDDMAPGHGGEGAASGVSEVEGAAVDGGAVTASAESGGVVLAVTSSVAGDEGDWSASPMSPTGEWQVGTGTGEFSYSYPMPAPASASGDAPSLGFGYSSGAIDGRTNANNPQPSGTGLGWSDFGTAFIERSYESCAGTQLAIPEQCWRNWNATLSLEGVGGQLSPTDDTYTEWRLESDPGWKVERLNGALNDVRQGEHWKVTATDGTEYWFGLGRNPDTGEGTASAWKMPVYGDRSDEPCYNNTLQVCVHMGWRWNLDRVVDPDGNVTTYRYRRGTNYYSPYGGFLGGNWAYHRGGGLRQIEYGERGGTPTARVRIEAQRRCVDLDSTCPEAKNSNGAMFPDIPNELICRFEDPTVCGAAVPSFFRDTRDHQVVTEVLVGGVWEGVDAWNLIHKWCNVSGCETVNSNSGLLLSQIQHVGLAGAADPSEWVVFPPTKFEHTLLQNRVDVDPGQSGGRMRNYRINRVINEFGGEIRATYGQNYPCAYNYNPRWDQNVQDCFPQTVIDRKEYTTLRTVGVFNKWLVTQVEEDPITGPAVVTSYEYEREPAWAYDKGAQMRYEPEWGWSVWRGYGVTTVTQGDAQSRVQVYRGMHGDPTMAQDDGQWCVCGERQATITRLDDSQGPEDEPKLVGRVLEEQQLGTVNGVSGEPVESTFYEYKIEDTLQTPADYNDNPYWVGVKSITKTVWDQDTGQPRSQRTSTTFQETSTTPGKLFQPATSVEEGWLDETGDERCSVTTYAHNEAEWMFEYPASNMTLAGDCETGDVLSRSETYYDGSTTLGELPSLGHPTMARSQIDGTTWAETTTTYDALGRPVTVTGPDGASVTTSYVASPAHAIPTESTDTNELNQSSTTQWWPQRQVPLCETDANGNVTAYTYDAAGRTRGVWLPTENPSDIWSSWSFDYSIANRTVRSHQRTGDPGQIQYESTAVTYDGLWRERQTQSRSPVSGTVVVSEMRYDAQGRVRDQLAPQPVVGTMGQGRIVVPDAAWDNGTRTVYDELGRPETVQDLQNNTVVRETTTDYGPETVTVTGPDGTKTRETTDVYGRVVSAEEWDGDSWVGSSYGYDLAGNMVSVTDPSGNTMSYTYNMAGWKLTQDDPNRGTASFTYDVAGRELSVTDALGNEVHNVYDVLGRQIERRADSPTGDLLASWEYDTAPGGIGMLASETSYTAEGNWVSTVDGYDQRGRSTGTTFTVPAGLPGLSGSYSSTHTYDLADRVTEVTYPAVGDLPAETVTTTYDSLGLAREMSGLEDYVWGIEYDTRSRGTAAAFGPPNAGGVPWMAQNMEYNDDQMLDATRTYVAGSGTPNGIVAEHEYTYSDAGLLDETVTSMSTLQWRECFTYDQRQRLTDAHTVDRSANCDTGTPGSGDRPYQEHYDYADDGRLLGRSETTGDGTSEWVYDYPTAGSDQSHAPTQVTPPGATEPDTYSWDANGNLTERTVDGDTETLTWDFQQQLAQVQGPEGTTSFTYDANGARLLRTTSNGTTLFLGSHEVTANGDGTQVTAVRNYTFGGSIIAARTTAGVQYMVSGADGSLEMSIDSSGTPAGDRSYSPYGQVRDETGDEFATDRGFVGQVEDDSTDLSYMNARYYDATLGLFISTDPIYDTGAIKSLNPYTYAQGNPATFADPTGLSPDYIHGLQQTVSEYAIQNESLRAHIKKLNQHIENLQGVIKKQRRQIHRMMSHIRTLEAQIRQQQATIRKLTKRVNHLVNVVNLQRAVMSQLYTKIAEQQQIINYQAGVIRYQQGVIAYQAGVIRYQQGVIAYQAGVAAYMTPYYNIGRAVVAAASSGAPVYTPGTYLSGGVADSVGRPVSVPSGGYLSGGVADSVGRSVIVPSAEYLSGGVADSVPRGGLDYGQGVCENLRGCYQSSPCAAFGGGHGGTNCRNSWDACGQTYCGKGPTWGDVGNVLNGGASCVGGGLYTAGPGAMAGTFVSPGYGSVVGGVIGFGIGCIGGINGVVWGP